MTSRSRYVVVSDEARRKGGSWLEYALSIGLTLLIVGGLGCLLWKGGRPIQKSQRDALFQAATKPALGTMGLVETPMAHSFLVDQAGSIAHPYVELPGHRIRVALSDGSRLVLNMADPRTALESMGPHAVTVNALSALQQITDSLRVKGRHEEVVGELEVLGESGEALAISQLRVDDFWSDHRGKHFGSTRAYEVFIAEKADTRNYEGLMRDIRLLHLAGGRELDRLKSQQCPSTVNYLQCVTDLADAQALREMGENAEALTFPLRQRVVETHLRQQGENALADVVHSLALQVRQAAENTYNTQRPAASRVRILYDPVLATDSNDLTLINSNNICGYANSDWCHGR